jgi:hypothetical protein
MPGPRWYSFAGPYRGLKFASDREFEDSPAAGSCAIPRCSGDCEHNILKWDGNGYSAERAWIAADEQSTIDLDDAR